MSGRLLVIGHDGQLARELRRRAAGEGWTTRAMGRGEIDLSRPAEAAQAVRTALESGVDAVVNAAAYTAVDKAESEPELAAAVNADAPGALAGECARVGIPFLHVSTDYVFSGDQAGPHREDAPLGPRSVYGRTKLDGERAVADAGGAFLIARTSWVYSPFGTNFVKTMLRLGESRDNLRVVSDQTGCPTAAADLAAGLLRAASAMAAGADGGIFHLAGQGETSWAGLAEAVFNKAAPRWGRRPQVEPISTAAWPTPAERPRDSRLNCARFEAVFGYRARPWRDAVTETVKEIFGADPEAAGP